MSALMYTYTMKIQNKSFMSQRERKNYSELYVLYLLTKYLRVLRYVRLTKKR